MEDVYMWLFFEFEPEFRGHAESRCRAVLPGASGLQRSLTITASLAISGVAASRKPPDRATENEECRASSRPSRQAILLFCYHRDWCRKLDSPRLEIYALEAALGLRLRTFGPARFFRRAAACFRVHLWAKSGVSSRGGCVSDASAGSQEQEP